MSVECLLEECFRRFYDDGALRYRTASRGKACGDLVGCGNGKGYLTVRVLGKARLVHRLLWLMRTGSWPDGLIDHINHDKTDNRPENLRVVSPSENKRNSPMQLNNSSGHVGVYWHAKAGKWQAFIGDGSGRPKYLGLFPDIGGAVEARRQAEAGLGYHKNHGGIDV